MSKLLNKDSLIEGLADKFQLTKVNSKEVLDFLLDEVTEALADGNSVSLHGFGKFEVRHRAERQGINPSTKEPITIKATNVPAFKAAKGLKDAVNSK